MEVSKTELRGWGGVTSEGGSQTGWGVACGKLREINGNGGPGAASEIFIGFVNRQRFLFWEGFAVHEHSLNMTFDCFAGIGHSLSKGFAAGEAAR